MTTLETRMTDYTIGATPGEAAANARLIAAAPELLEACKWFMAQLDAGHLVRDTSRDGEPDCYAHMHLGVVAEAIAKAEATP